MSFNVEPAVKPIVIKRGDTWDQAFEVYKNGDPFYMDGMKIDLKVKSPNGTYIKELSSEGSSPAIIINGYIFEILTTSFSIVTPCNYDVQITDGTKVYTYMEGPVIITDDI